MQDGQIDNDFDANPGHNLSEMKEALDAFRKSVHAAAVKPEIFWERQHAAIVSKIQNSTSEATSWIRWIWIPVAPALLLCILFLGVPRKEPKTDLPAGADQILLVEIENALHQESPEAIVPVTLPDWKMVQPGKRKK
jgi:hypothetical protein